MLFRWKEINTAHDQGWRATRECPGPLLWNEIKNDLLHLFPKAQTLVGDTALSVIYSAQNDAVTATTDNTLQAILTWGNRWQVKFTQMGPMPCVFALIV